VVILGSFCERAVNGDTEGLWISTGALWRLALAAAILQSAGAAIRAFRRNVLRRIQAFWLEYRHFFMHPKE
jgi:hypothetical protein